MLKFLLLIPVLIFFAIFFGVAFLIYKVIRKSLTPKSEEYIKNEFQEMQARIDVAKTELKAWEGHSFSDITALMKYRFKKTTTNYLRGKILNTENQAIIAFDRVERGMAANGYMFASSTAFDFFYDIRVDEFTIKLNQQLLGEIKKDGSIYNAQNQRIGFAKHPQKVSFNIGAFDFRRGDNKFPLKMNGRHLANIRVAPNYSSSSSSTISLKFNENLGTASNIELLDKPTKEEEDWLLALAILETAFHGHWMI